MALALPRFIAIKSFFDEHYAHLKKAVSFLDSHFVCIGEENVFSPYAKIEVERAKIDNKYVQLRFCYSGKYWASFGLFISASDKPEEDKSGWKCTLFEPTLCETSPETNGNSFKLRHVQSGRLVRTGHADRATTAIGLDKCLRIEGGYDEGSDSVSLALFHYVDWDTLVVMPKHLAFKGYNNKYLRSAWFQRHEYLDFSSNDCGKETTAYEVTMKPDGHLRIKSKFFGKFWRRSPNWIWGDSSDDVGYDTDTLFWPVKVDDSTIALRNGGNKRFCSSLTTEGKTDCLNAAVPTITTEARLKVEELVLERQIIDVVYRMDHARISNEKPFVAGTGAATNNTQEPATLTIRISYQDTTSYSFSNSLSLRTGVKTTIKTGFARIVEGKIEISAEVTGSLEWNRMTTETKAAEATYQAIVPPMSRIKVNYVATQGTCNVPFSYTQRDKLSTDGSFVTTQNIVGSYTGVNCYNFHFEQNVVEAGMKIDKNTNEQNLVEAGMKMDKNTIESMTPGSCSACVFN